MPLFVDNVAAAVEKLGVDKVGIIWGLATYPWPSEEQRDRFLDLVTRKRD